MDCDVKGSALGIDLGNSVSWGFDVSSGFEAQGGDLTISVDLNPHSESVVVGVEEGIEEVVLTVRVRVQNYLGVRVHIN